MKKLMSIVEVQGEGLEALLGKQVLVFCAVYIYHGTLTGVNDKCILVENCSIVYETGSFTDKKLKDAQPLPLKEHRIMMSMIESVGEWTN